MKSKRIFGFAALALAAIVMVGCGNGAGSGAPGAAAGGTTEASGKVIVDGSSTVAPISQRMSEAFKEVAPNIQVPVGESGTGSGFKKFIAGEIDICGASRPIKPEEVEKAKEAGVEFIELPVAYDGLSIVVNKQNDWLNTITTAELQKLWAPNSTVKKWSELRAGFPDREIKLYGPATNHGTYEYFAEAIVKDKSKATRQDYQQNQEYNTLVAGVGSDLNALGYVGYAYYEANQDKLRVIPVDAGNGPITPSMETIENGQYAPLSRPLFIYVSKKSLETKPAVKQFVEFYMQNAKQLVSDAKFIPLPDALYTQIQARLSSMTAGTLYTEGTEGKTLKEIMAAQAK